MRPNRKTLLTALLLATVCHIAWAAGMPVLRVTFDGTFTPDMPYADGTMHLTDTDGTVVQLPAKFRIRGATARSYLMKPSFNMKLRTADYTEEADSSLLGMRSCSSWILDGMAIDRICMRNRVAFDIWNEFSRLPYDTDFGGRNGTEGRFVEVYVNSQYYGIYCLSDRINRKLLNLKKARELSEGEWEVRGLLYKSGTQDIADQNSPGYNDDYTACTVEWHNAWELTYPEDFASPAVWEPLQTAILQGRSASYVRKYFFLDNLAEYQIHVMALSIGDNWGNKNHYLSIRNVTKDIDDADPTEADRRRFVLTPWDLDTSLGGAYDGSYYDGTYSDWPVRDIQKNSPYPICYVSGDSEYLALLRQKWAEGRRGALSAENVRRKLEAYRDLFLQSGAWQRMVAHFDQSPTRPCYVSDLSREVELVAKWYEARFCEMDAYFGTTDSITDRLTSPSGTTVGTAYDLQGRPVVHPVPQIVIRGGKKYFTR